MDRPELTTPDDPARLRQGRRRSPAAENGEAAASAPPAVPKRIRVECPECGARFQTAVAAARRLTECIACAADVPVPARDDLLRAAEASVAEPSSGRRRGARTDDDVRVDTVADEPVRKRRRRRKRRIDPWGTFFEGVFLFPWREGVFSRWLLLSFGCSVVGIASVMMLYVAAMGMIGGVWAMRMAWGWSCILTFGYAAACCLPIVTETAAGADRVEGWPEPYWKDWALDLLRVAITVLEVAALAFGPARLIELGTGYFWLPFLVGGYILFPICMLSSMHADSAFVPITPAILLSLVKCWWAWLIFYVAVALVAIVWPGMLVLGFGYGPWLTVIATAPLMSAAIFIYARLLGRLGRVLTSTLAG